MNSTEQGREMTRHDRGRDRGVTVPKSIGNSLESGRIWPLSDAVTHDRDTDIPTAINHNYYWCTCRRRKTRYWIQRRTDTLERYIQHDELGSSELKDIRNIDDPLGLEVEDEKPLEKILLVDNENFTIIWSASWRSICRWKLRDPTRIPRDNAHLMIRTRKILNVKTAIQRTTDRRWRRPVVIFGDHFLIKVVSIKDRIWIHDEADQLNEASWNVWYRDDTNWVWNSISPKLRNISILWMAKWRWTE